MGSFERRIEKLELAIPPRVDLLMSIDGICVCLALGQTRKPPFDGHILGITYPDGSPIYAKDVIAAWRRQPEKLGVIEKRLLDHFDRTDDDDDEPDPDLDPDPN
jgi:hypothetical protein